MMPEKLIQPQRIVKTVIFTAVAAVHIILLVSLKLNLSAAVQDKPEPPKVIKLVDVREFVPPPPPVEKEPVHKIQINDQPTASETIIAVDDKIEITESAPAAVEYREPDYLPQHKISKIPAIPSDQVLARMIYPPMALRQNLEAVVYVELFIDENGLVRKVSVLKDPGHGFAEAAVNALEGLRCAPAEANGVPVAVRYRYPIRFVLN